jgi:predicted nucleic acid-binding protein
MDKLVLDANVLVRYLRADHEAHFSKVQKLFAQADEGKIKLILLDAVLAEVVFVLSSVYACSRQAIADALKPFIVHGAIECDRASLLVDALNRYALVNVDYMDCYLAAVSADRNCPVITFDQDFRKFKDIKSRIPGD